MGSTNRVADALSRKHSGEVILSSLLTIPVVSWDELETEVHNDPVLGQLKQEIVSQEKEHTGYSVVEGRLFYKGRYVIPRTSLV